jgi:hypothetical protein
VTPDDSDDSLIELIQIDDFHHIILKYAEIRRLVPNFSDLRQPSLVKAVA